MSWWVWKRYLEGERFADGRGEGGRNREEIEGSRRK